MRGSKNSKRVTWAPDHILCQVRLFSSAKPPSEVGLVASTRWRCPARMELTSEWQMVAGEESKEVEAQKQRERTVLEAVFPRPSSIPLNPRLPVNAQESVVDEQNIPLIPMTPMRPIQEAGASNASAMNIPQQPQNQVVSSQCDGSAMNIPQQPQNQVLSSQCDGSISVEGAQPASFVSNSSDQDQTNLIDTDLLMRILANPGLVQRLLITTRQEPSTQNIPNSELQPSNSTGIAINGQASLSTPTMKTELNAPTTSTPAAPFRPPQLGTGFVSTSGPSSPVVKDINYYKSLIQQHGGGGGGGSSGGCVLPQSCSQSNRLMGGTAQEFGKPTKSRIMKPCIFYNSNRGCKNGANCAYQHDFFASQKRAGCATEVFEAKRIKLGR